MRYARKLSIFLIILTILSLNTAMAIGNKEDIHVYMHNEKMELDVPPVIDDGRVLVPLRGIFEKIGAKVKWDNDTRTVEAITRDKNIKLTIDHNVAYVNGEQIILDVPAKIINESTYVPIRFIAESMGYEVEWDANTYSVLINSDYPYGNYKPTEVMGDGNFRIKDEDGSLKNVHMIGLNIPANYQIDFYDYLKETLFPIQDGYRVAQTVALDYVVDENNPNVFHAYVWRNGNLLNAEAIKKGLAKKDETVDANSHYGTLLVAAENTAKNSNQGLWDDGSTIVNKPEEPKDKDIAADKESKYVGNTKTLNYHLPSCKWIKDIHPDIEVRFSSVKDAKNQGYTKCNICIKE